MIIQWRSLGAVAALALIILLAPRWATAQDDLNGGVSGGTLNHGGATDGGFGAADFGKPPQSNLAVRIYDPKIEYARGVTHLEVGDYRDAIDNFENALSVDPDKLSKALQLKCLYELGMARSGAGNPRGAVTEFELALSIDPKQIAVRREYAVVLAKLGQADKAQAQLAILKARADACRTTCGEADELKTALAMVQAALSPTPGAAPTGPG